MRKIEKIEKKAKKGRTPRFPHPALQGLADLKADTRPEPTAETCPVCLQSRLMSSFGITAGDRRYIKEHPKAGPRAGGAMGDGYYSDCYDCRKARREASERHTSRAVAYERRVRDEGKVPVRAHKRLPSGRRKRNAVRLATKAQINRLPEHLRFEAGAIVSDTDTGDIGMVVRIEHDPNSVLGLEALIFCLNDQTQRSVPLMRLVHEPDLEVHLRASTNSK